VIPCHDLRSDHQVELVDEAVRRDDHHPSDPRTPQSADPRPQRQSPSIRRSILRPARSDEPIVQPLAIVTEGVVELVVEAGDVPVQ
jgi:hypothetical protein